MEQILIGKGELPDLKPPDLGEGSSRAGVESDWGGETVRTRWNDWRFAVGYQTPAGHGGNAGQADRAHRGKPAWPANLVRRAGRHIRRVTPPLA